MWDTDIEYLNLRPINHIKWAPIPYYVFLQPRQPHRLYFTFTQTPSRVRGGGGGLTNKNNTGFITKFISSTRQNLEEV